MAEKYLFCDNDRIPEESLIVSSPNVATYDRKPEMSVGKIVEEFKKAILKDYYNFYIINFANPDMVAHSGNIKATVKAVEATDRAVGVVTDLALLTSGMTMITADHGNAEELLSFPTRTFFFTTAVGSVNTEHSNSPVPFYLIDPRFKGKTDMLEDGNLADVAPPVLVLMGLPVPSVMTGHSLIRKEKLNSSV